MKKTGQENLKPKGFKISVLDRIKIAFNVQSGKKHSHDRENERRRRQIERGILKLGPEIAPGLRSLNIK